MATTSAAPPPATLLQQQEVYNQAWRDKGWDKACKAFPGWIDKELFIDFLLAYTDGNNYPEWMVALCDERIEQTFPRLRPLSKVLCHIYHNSSFMKLLTVHDLLRLQALDDASSIMPTSKALIKFELAVRRKMLQLELAPRIWERMQLSAELASPARLGRAGGDGPNMARIVASFCF